MHLLTRSAVIATSAAAIVAAASAPTSAAREKEQIPLVCGGTTYSVVVNGNGNFTPARDSATNRMFIPTSFGEFHGTATDSSGTVLDDFTDPPVAKGQSGKAPRASMTCTYEVHETFEDPDLGLVTFDGTGSVTGFWTPAR